MIFMPKEFKSKCYNIGSLYNRAEFFIIDTKKFIINDQ